MRFFFIALLLLSSNMVFGRVHEVASIEELEYYVDNSTLILLDIDNTLMRPRQTLGSDEWFSDYFERHLKENPTNPNARTEALDLWHKIENLSDYQPMEKNTASAVATLQDKKCTVMALTTRGSMIADATFRQLDMCGIDLKKTAPTQGNFMVPGVDCVLWRDGVLFSNGRNKGQVLTAFLDHIHLAPKRIVFINDKLSHLQEVEGPVEARGIEFLGLRYSGADIFVKNYRRDLGDIEFRVFQKLLSDRQAELLLEKSATASVEQ